MQAENAVSWITTWSRFLESEFSFSFAPGRPGLWTFVFYTASRELERARPGGSAVVWVN